MRKHQLYGAGMNIGGRIQKKLSELGWERKDLLSKVPDLTPQALSNLIKRDSVRSEWDQAIADALGVSVLWLVYDIQNSEPPKPDPALQSPLVVAALRLDRDPHVDRRTKTAATDILLSLCKTARPTSLADPAVLGGVAVETRDFAPIPSLAHHDDDAH